MKKLKTMIKPRKKSNACPPKKKSECGLKVHDNSIKMNGINKKSEKNGEKGYF